MPKSKVFGVLALTAVVSAGCTSYEHPHRYRHHAAPDFIAGPPPYGYYHGRYWYYRGDSWRSWNDSDRCWRLDRDDNPPGPRGGPGTNWENPPGPMGGPGASPDRWGDCR